MSMTSRIIIGLLIGSWLLAAEIIYTHKDSVVLVNVPPQSLSQWYKPENKRHVWLHTMFNLRREMQAIRSYAAVEDETAVAEWVGKFTKHYNKIAEMVPQWESRLEPDILEQLQKYQASNNFSEIPHILTEMQESCDSCHDRYRTVTALLYRAPDFTSAQIDSEHSYSESMGMLNTQINDIKLSFLAGKQDKALGYLDDLKIGIDALGGTCAECHKYSPKTYPSAAISKAIVELEAQLQTQDVSLQGRALGGLAVLACAECHGTHRIAADTRQLLTEKTHIGELLAH